MKHRKTYGFAEDARVSAALTMADERATERIYEAADWRETRRREKNAIDSRLRRLDESDRKFARAVLRGKSWPEMKLAKSTFSDMMKKIEILLSAP